MTYSMDQEDNFSKTFIISLSKSLVDLATSLRTSYHELFIG